jgi:hypothetical protein
VHAQDAVGVLVGDVDQLEERLVLEQRLPHINKPGRQFSSGNHTYNLGADSRGKVMFAMTSLASRKVVLSVP